MGSGRLQGVINERVRRFRVGHRIHEVVEHEYDKVQGKVCVQLHDERGKLVHEERQTNFISRHWEPAARSWQRLAWAKWLINYNAGIDVPAPEGAGWQPIQMPNSTLACWFDDTVESPTTENHVRTSADGLIAWATRFPVGSPIGARGVVNVDESEWNLTGESMVYDWPTTTGNGTYRSVGYIASTQGTGLDYAVPLLRANPRERKYLYTTGDPLGFWGTTSTRQFGDCGVNASTRLIIPSSTSGSLLDWVDIPLTDWNQAWTFDGGGAGEATMSATVVTGAAIGATNAYTNFLGEHGGKYWFGFAGSAQGKFCRIDPVTKAVDRVVTLPTVTTGGYAPNGAIIGSDLFITPSSTGSDFNKIWRYDLTANPPNLTATITAATPTWMTTSTNVTTSTSTDGTSLYIMYYHSGGGLNRTCMLKVSTSGDVQDVMGKIQTAAFFENGSNPYPGGYSDGGFGVFEPMDITRPFNQGSISEAVSSWPATMGQYHQSGFYAGGLPANPGLLTGQQNNKEMFFYGDGALQSVSIAGLTIPDQRIAVGISDYGHNLGSRVLLGSNTTKTSGNTMKITYDITLPAFIT